MTPFELALFASRGVQLAATMSFAGALAFRVGIAPFAVARVLWPSLAVAVAAAVAWLLLQAADFSEAATLGEMLKALPAAAFGTRFGHVLLLRLAILALAAVAAARGRSAGLLAAAALGSLAVAIEAGLGHVAAAADPVLIASLVVHLLAATVWLGSLLPLWLALRGEQPGATARRFSLLGIMAVAAIAATALQQASLLVGGLPGFVGTEYGHTALVKIGFFLVLLALAVVNRFVLTPALDNAPAALRRLRVSVLLEAALGLAVVLTAARLASLPPGVHLQPEWPFAWRPSLDALADPTLRGELLPALIGAGAAMLLLALGLAARRIRWVALAGAIVLAGLALPHLDLLLVPAYPTSFYTSLTDFDAYGIAQGARLFAKNCTPCHGADGRGDGVLAKTLPLPPADLTAEHLWAHTDGEMFWYLTHGIQGPRGDLAMPGFEGAIGSEGRWLLIDYLRAHNAGAALSERGGWNHPIPAPELEARCGDGKVVALEDFRGKVVRISVTPPAAAPGLPTLFIDGARPTEDTCVAGAPEVRLAYAIVTGTTPDRLAGTVFLVDPAGWLRVRIRPTDPPPDYAALAAQLIANPVVAPAGVGHHH